VKQSLPVLNALRAKLGTSEKNKTTLDMMFTLETVACLGACGLAPVVVIDEQVYGQVTPERALGLVEDIKAAEMLMATAGAIATEQPAGEECHE
jgi:NADH-quinone oxidoreductase subunit E